MEKAEAHFVECGITAIIKHYIVYASLVDTGGHGASLDPEGTTMVVRGSSLDFTVTNPGNDLVYITIDDGDAVYLSDSNPVEYTLEDIQENHTLLFTTDEALPG